jgi:hypothetical protein
MKESIAVIFAFILTLTAYAQVHTSGYVVMAGQDTVTCTIKLAGKKKVTDYYTLVLVDSNGEEIIYKAEDKAVDAFGFELLGKKYDYRFVEIFKTYESGFFQLIDDGPNYKLYVNYIPVPNNVQAHYALFRPNGEYVDLTTHKLGSWKKNLRSFFGDNPAALAAIENLSAKEIPDFVKNLNKVE